MSRIHISVGYDRLNDDARAKIWDNLFDKLKDGVKRGGQRIDDEYDAKYYVKKNQDLKDLQWNGREIRNGMFVYCSLCTKIAQHFNIFLNDADCWGVQRSKQQSLSPSMTAKKPTNAIRRAQSPSSQRSKKSILPKLSRSRLLSRST
jgi:hypothetical protein